MAPFLYGSRNKIHIIDLTQTVPMLHQALKAVRDAAAQGGRVPFVGTKRRPPPDRGRGEALRAVLRQSPLARRHVDQLADDFQFDQALAFDRRDAECRRAKV